MTQKFMKVSVEKETMDLFDALSVLVGDIKNGKDVGTIVSDALPKVITAVTGYDQIPNELKQEDIDATFALGGLKIKRAIAPHASTNSTTTSVLEDIA